MSAAGDATRGPSNKGPKVMTTMKDFIILSKIGKLPAPTQTLIKTDLLCIVFAISGDGAYSEVYKVKRNTDNAVYALKKVKLPRAT